MTPVASLRGVRMTYAAGAAEVRALEGVNFDARGGELVLLMGPSGSGKTTLLSILGCILTPSAGSVRIRGREVGGLRQSQLPEIRLRHVGFVFQGFNLLPALSARENVELPLGLMKASRGEMRRRALELLDAVGVAEKRDALPGELSGGQKQRVAIARALAGQPDMILADEPTAALDSRSGRGIMELLRDFGRRNERAVVVVTHDPRTLEFADRVVRMEDGRIQDGDAE
jgi:putative ABC transport system ATP-binding protein